MTKILGPLLGIGLALGVAAASFQQRAPLVEHVDITNDGLEDVVLRNRQGIEVSCLVQQPDGQFHPTGVKFDGYIGPFCETVEGFYNPINHGVFLYWDLKKAFQEQAPPPGPYFFSAGGIGSAL